MELKKNSEITVTTNPKFEKACTSSTIYVDYKNITKVLSTGSRIFLDDGLISLLVNEISKSFQK